MEKRLNPQKIKNSLCVMLILALLGFIISTQINSLANDHKQSEIELQEQMNVYRTQIAALTQQLQENTEKHDVLMAQYNTEMKKLFDNNKQFYEMYKKYEKDVAQYKFYAGLTNVQGRGIDIGLDDEVVGYGSTSGEIIHDVYINDVVNTLRSAGAQAIDINGERVQPMSEILCLGPSIRVNGTKLFAPYHIQAIGDPQTLANTFKNSPIYYTMKSKRLKVDVVIVENIVISKYNKSYKNSIDLLQENK